MVETDPDGPVAVSVYVVVAVGDTCTLLPEIGVAPVTGPLPSLMDSEVAPETTQVSVTGAPGIEVVGEASKLEIVTGPTFPCLLAIQEVSAASMIDVLRASRMRRALRRACLRWADNSEMRTCQNSNLSPNCMVRGLWASIGRRKALLD